MKYRLICADIDGTLLNDKKEISLPTIESLRHAAERGVSVALVSGRMPAGVELIEKELGFPCIKVCNAGTYILQGDRCIFSQHMQPEDMRAIGREVARKHSLALWIFRGRKWYVTEIDGFIRREIGIIRTIPELANEEELAECWEQEGTGPNKLLLAADPRLIPTLHREIEGLGRTGVRMACSADTFLEIFPRGVTKGTALTAVCRQLGIPPEQTLAFGDHELDIPMIEAAGVGIAMENAIDGLKEKADYVTKSNNEDGIAWALEKLLDES